MKGIILAGGKGTRLYPLTQSVNKHLLPVYSKPMIFYPLSLLMMGDVRDILIISNECDIPYFKQVLGDGENYGIRIQYAVQDKPSGLPEAFIIGEDFIGDDDVILMLGDNLLFGDIEFYKSALKVQNDKNSGIHGQIFGYFVSNPESYGVVEFDLKSQKVLSLEEKPKVPKSNYAIPGIYIFDSTVVEKAKKVRPSKRNETEIIDVIKEYWLEDSLRVEIITRGVAWMDMGTPKRLLEASNYVQSIEDRQGLNIASLEEIALRKKFITREEFKRSVALLPASSYKDYLINYDKFFA